MRNCLLKELIKSFRSQNMEVYPLIFDEFKKLISIYSYRIGGEDAYQELVLFFVELLYTVNIENFKSDDTNGLSRYIAVSIRNKYIALSKENCKYNSLVLQLPDDYIFSGDVLDSNLETEELLSKLSSRQRAVIIYRYIYRYSDAEISQMLGISRQAVNRLKNRALEILQYYYFG